MRQEFTFKSMTNMNCYSLRMKDFREILSDYRQFYQPYRRKALQTYARGIYFPLMRFKSEMLFKLNQRNDFEQIIGTRSFTNSGIVKSMKSLLFENIEQQRVAQFEQSCLNDIKSIRTGIYQMEEFGIKIRLKLEFHLQVFQNIYLDLIKRNCLQHSMKNKKRSTASKKKTNELLLPIE